MTSNNCERGVNDKDNKGKIRQKKMGARTGAMEAEGDGNDKAARI